MSIFNSLKSKKMNNITCEQLWLWYEDLSHLITLSHHNNNDIWLQNQVPEIMTFVRGTKTFDSMQKIFILSDIQTKLASIH